MYHRDRIGVAGRCLPVHLGSAHGYCAGANSRMAFGSGVKLPAALQWLSWIAWDGLVGLFGGEALALLLGIPFWVAVLIVLVLQGAVGFSATN